MSKYIIISRLTDEGGKALKKNASRIKEVNKELKNMGVKVIDQYAVLGNFDFLNIVEAENETVVVKAVIEMASLFLFFPLTCFHLLRFIITSYGLN